MLIKVLGKENVKKSIIAIGQELIDRADDICRDINDVRSITIHAELIPNEYCNFDITKNYNANYKEEDK